MAIERRYLIGLAITLVFIVFGRYYLAPGKILVGDDAPDFDFTDLQGKDRHLSEFGARYVILSFWGSWCDPCRVSNKKLVDFYRNQDTNTLVVISVGIEKDINAWKKAIEQDSLFWDEQFTPLHLFDNSLAKNYQVDQTPEYFLINTQQKIIDRSAKIETIIQKLNSFN